MSKVQGKIDFSVHHPFKRSVAVVLLLRGSHICRD